MYATTFDDHYHGETAPDPIEPGQPDERPFVTERPVRWELVGSAAVGIVPGTVGGVIAGVRLYWFWRGD